MPPAKPATQSVRRPEWQTEMLRLTVLYRLEECGEVLGLVCVGEKHEFIDLDLSDMHIAGLIEPKGDRWAVTQKGRAVLAQAVAMFDHVLKFEVFGAVELTRNLTDKECQDNDPLLVLDYLYDPRFLPPGKASATSEDMRIAMMTFLTEQMSEKLEGRSIDPHRIVFLQKLASGRIRSNEPWFDLRAGTFFTEIEKIATAAYQWRDISGDENSAIEAMRSLYQSGMMEQRKRDGYECAKCGIPLAVFQLVAEQQGQPFECCPNPDCGTAFKPPAPPQGSAEYECPSCHGDIFSGQRKCRGCGARIDFSLPSGSVESVTTATTTTEVVYDPYVPVWGGYASYGYVPYGYYDPWDPFVDALAFGCLCAVLW